jgi:hypothetical protein
VVIVAGLYAVLSAIWAPPGLGPAEAAAEALRHGVWWWAHAIGGSLALSSIFVAMKSVVLARILAAAGAFVLLAGLVAFDTIGWLAIRMLVLPAVLILAATPFIGPLPTPEDEGMPREAIGESAADATRRRF